MTQGQGKRQSRKTTALRAEPDAELFTNISSNWETKERQKISAKSQKFN
jgi:hypothetical protein